MKGKRFERPIAPPSEVVRRNLLMGAGTEHEAALMTALRLSPNVRLQWSRLGYTVVFNVSADAWGIIEVNIEPPQATTWQKRFDAYANSAERDQWNGQLRRFAALLVKLDVRVFPSKMVYNGMDLRGAGLVFEHLGKLKFGKARK